ncbi:MAG: tetratricopeptide repeat protein [bacterium]
MFPFGMAANTLRSLLLTAFLCCWLLPSAALRGQWLEDPRLDEKIVKGIDAIYSMEFEKADKEFFDVVRAAPDHPAGYFFQCMTQWWRLLVNFQDESKDELYYAMIEKVLEVCEERLDRNPNDVTALFFKGGAIGFRGRLRVNRNKWIAAANDGIIALCAVRRAYELEPENSDVLLGIGMYNYYAEIIPAQYPIVKPFMLFLPSGDKKKGLEQLIIASQQARYARIEAVYFLVQSYFSYEKQYWKALELARELHVSYPRNPVFHRMYGRCFVGLGNWSEAFKIFSDVEKHYREKQFGYDVYDAREAYYYLGKFLFLAGRLDESLKSFLQCDELCRRLDKEGASGFMSMANLTMGFIFDLQKKRGSALAQYQKVLNMREFENTHRDAQKYMRSPYSR